VGLSVAYGELHSATPDARPTIRSRPPVRGLVRRSKRTLSARSGEAVSNVLVPQSVVSQFQGVSPNLVCLQQVPPVQRHAVNKVTWHTTRRARTTF
jgi:hypothetical protein